VARIYGCHYELWDLNPLLGVLHEVAVQKPKDLDVASLLRQMQMSKETFVPKWRKLDYWFHEDFHQLLFRAWGFYHSLMDEYSKRLLVVPLLKVTRHFSYDDVQRQKLSKSPKAVQRVQALLKSDWKRKFFHMLEEEIIEVLKKLYEYQRYSPADVKYTVKAGVDTMSEKLEEEADILVTSPPYLQSHEYIRRAKMDLFWLGFSEEEIKRLSELEIPYRDVPPHRIRSEMYWKLRDRIDAHHLRRTFDNYFWAVVGALERLGEMVSSHMFLFVGRASMRGRSIPIDQIVVHCVTLTCLKSLPTRELALASCLSGVLCSLLLFVCVYLKLIYQKARALQQFLRIHLGLPYQPMAESNCHSQPACKRRNIRKLEMIDKKIIPRPPFPYTYQP